MQNVNDNLYLLIYTHKMVFHVQQNMTISLTITIIIPYYSNPIHVVISHPSRERKRENTRNLMEIDMHKIVKQNYLFNEHATCLSHESLPLQILWL